MNGIIDFIYEEEDLSRKIADLEMPGNYMYVFPNFTIASRTFRGFLREMEDRDPLEFTPIVEASIPKLYINLRDGIQLYFTANPTAFMGMELTGGGVWRKCTPGAYKHAWGLHPGEIQIRMTERIRPTK